MADIDQIIAGGAKTNADFDFSKINRNYWEGRDQAAKNDLRDAFKGGVPLTPDGQPDFGAMAKTLFQKGGLNEGTAAANLGIAQQNMQFGQGQNRAIQNFDSGGQPQAQAPQAPLVSPSTNRQVPIAGNAPVLAAAAPLPPDQQQDPTSAVVRMPTAQATQDWRNSVPPPQAGPQLAQAPPQMAPQGQPAPVTNAVTTTQAPATPSRVDQGIAFFSAIMADPRSPKQNVELAKSRLEALQESNKLTNDQKNYVQYKLEGGKGTMEDFLNRADENTTQRDILTKSTIPRLEKSQDKATSAIEDIDAIHRSRNELDQPGGVITGVWASDRLKLAKIGNSLGIPNSDKITNTEAFSAAVGKRVAAMVKAFGSGTAISDGDRRFAEKMAGGGIELNETSMRRILDIGEQADRAVIGRHNEFADKAVKSNEGLKSARDTFIVQQPGQYKKQSAGVFDSARDAIAKGAPRDAVMKRLRENGHDPAGL